jgi:hypothetical protein
MTAPTAAREALRSILREPLRNALRPTADLIHDLEDAAADIEDDAELGKRVRTMLLHYRGSAQ